MARKKIDPELSLNEMDENAEENLEENLDPDTELDLNEDSSEEEEAAPKAKAKSRRKSSAKKRKEPAGVAGLLASASAPVVEAEAEAKEEITVVVDTNVAEEKPKRESKPRTKLVIDEAPVADVAAAASVAVDGEVPTVLKSALDIARPVEDTPKAAEGVERPWNAMKDVSQAMVQNLERISKSMNDIPALKLRIPKATLVTKLALGFSAVAMVLSFIALSLAQSARQQAIALRSVPAETVAMRPSRRVEKPNEELTRLAKEVARSATAPLAPAAVVPEKRPTPDAVKPATSNVPKPRPAVKPVARRAKPTAAAPAAPRTIREARSLSAPRPASGGLQPDAARVKALSDLARTAASRRRVAPQATE